MGVELAGHELLPDDVAQVVQALEPGGQTRGKACPSVVRRRLVTHDATVSDGIQGPGLPGSQVDR